MKVVLHIAVSINGYMARPDGNEDFISLENWQHFCALSKEYNNLIVGIKTYEAVEAWGPEYSFDNLGIDQKMILSHDKTYPIKDGYTLVSSPHEGIFILQEKKFETVLLSGGSHVNSAFIRGNLIDEIIMNVEPVVVGTGIPLFVPYDFEQRLELISSTQLEKGILSLKYRVLK
ncbi:MAG TPA: dihydrofolate reductase family protein [Candidatus Magasanikbacteria bacterium]|nr:dihydrofolate reductase family protein [Candidatus Magasanikbacteria bacterium]